MKKIGILTNYHIPDKSLTAIQAAKEVLLAGGTPLLPDFADRNLVSSVCGSMTPEFCPISSIYETAEAIFVVGGDGSVIEAAKKATLKGIPVLGINRGRIGYITELEPDELPRISEIIQGSFRMEKRFLLKAEVLRNGTPIKSGICCNDAVISNGYSGKVLELRLSEGNAGIADYRADGLIISTPTGSTAYSLSAGGPVIDCRAECYCVTPICAHSPAARALVFPADVALELRNTGSRNPEAALFLDGKYLLRLTEKDTLRISDAGIRAQFIRIKPMKTYFGLCKKLGS